MLLAKTLLLALLANPTLGAPQERTQFPACEQAQVNLIAPEEWRAHRSSRDVFFPDEVGNFDSIQEARQTLAPEAKKFVSLVSNAVVALSQAQREYAESLAKCLFTNKHQKQICADKQLRELIERDRQAISENWKRMRLGLALGFTNILCAGMCDSFELDLVHPFAWAKTSARPSILGERPFREDKAGAITQREAQEADQKLLELTKEIRNRPITFWERVSQTDLGSTPELQRAREISFVLNKPNYRDGMSFREYWRSEYFNSIRLAPLLLLVSRPNPSDKEMRLAYDTVARNARELVISLNTTDTMQAWDYLNLTTRDVLLSYHGIIDTILSSPEHQRYCGIAERMLREKISNDSTKFAIVVGSTIATGVGCVLTGSTYVGLGLCALTSMGLTIKTDMDAQEQAQVAKHRAGSSATPSLLIDDFESLSAIDQQAVLSENLRYLALIDVGILTAATVKLTGRALQFYYRLEKFSAELARTSKNSPRAIRAALKVILRDSPNMDELRRASDILARLPEGALTTENASDVGMICRSVAPLISDAETTQWATRIAALSRGGNDSVRGLAMVTQRAHTLFLLSKAKPEAVLRQAVAEESRHVQWESGRLLSNAERKKLQDQMLSCLGLL